MTFRRRGHRGLLATLAFLSAASMAADGPDSRSAAAAREAGTHALRPQDCDELDDCIAEDLALSNEQQQQVRDILEQARKQRDALREDTFSRLKDVLTPEQARRLEEHRSDLMRYRAQRMRERAGRLDRRARELRPAPPSPAPPDNTSPPR